MGTITSQPRSANEPACQAWITENLRSSASRIAEVMPLSTAPRAMPASVMRAGLTEPLPDAPIR